MKNSALMVMTLVLGILIGFSLEDFINNENLQGDKFYALADTKQVECLRKYRTNLDFDSLNVSGPIYFEGLKILEIDSNKNDFNFYRDISACFYSSYIDGESSIESIPSLVELVKRNGSNNVGIYKPINSSEYIIFSKE